jgi:ankyrin repeat protein
MSPLHYAVQNDKTLPLAQLLIEEAGADIYMHSKNGHSVYDYALNYKAFETVKYIKQYVKLQIALGLNCRDIVFSGSKARKFCIDQLKPDIVASKNPHELEKIGNQMMEDRMKNGLNARALPTEVIEHITGYVLAPNL